MAYAYQWIRVNRLTLAETTIVGATAALYTPVAADYPYRLKVRVTITKLNYNSQVLFADAAGLRIASRPGYAPPGYASSVIVEVDQVALGGGELLRLPTRQRHVRDHRIRRWGRPQRDPHLVALRPRHRRVRRQLSAEPDRCRQDDHLQARRLDPGIPPTRADRVPGQGPVALAILDLVGSPGVTGPVRALTLTANVTPTDVMPAATSRRRCSGCATASRSPVRPP